MAELPDASLLDFTTTVVLTPSDLLYVGIVDTSVQEGYNDANVMLSTLATAMLTQFSYPLALTKTTSKTITGSIEEIAYKEFSGTLTSGSTTIAFTDALITSSSTIEVYVDSTTPISYESLVVTESQGQGTATITFEAQSSNLSVKVRVW